MGLNRLTNKRELTPKQIENLRRGREKLDRKRKREKKKEAIRKNKRESIKKEYEDK